MKPLGIKAYGHVPHLPGSRMGTGDHHCHDGQAAMCCEKSKMPKHDVVIVQEKLDGSCVSIAKLDGKLLPLTRAGYLASSSPYRQHHMFEAWVWERQRSFLEILGEGERVVGEWLALAHGTRYALPHEPFVMFDHMVGQVRSTVAVVESLANVAMVPTPRIIHRGGRYRFPRYSPFSSRPDMAL